MDSLQGENQKKLALFFYKDADQSAPEGYSLE